MTTVRAFVARHSVPTYFVLTFAISWGGALLAIGGSGELAGTTQTSDPRFPFAVLAMLAGPSVAGILFTGVVHGRAGLHEFPSRLLNCRVRSRWYAVALLTAPVLWVVTLTAFSLASSTFLPGIVTSTDKPGLIMVGLAVALGAGIFEDLGWTGFAITPLRCICHRVRGGRCLGRMAPAHERLLGKPHDCGGAVALDFRPRERYRFSHRVPRGLQGVDGVGLRPHGELALGDRYARESHGQRADSRSRSAQGRSPFGLFVRPRRCSLGGCCSRCRMGSLAPCAAVASSCHAGCIG